MLRAGPFDEPAERLRLRESVSRLLARRLPPKRALALDREGSFDRSVWEALAQVGVLEASPPMRRSEAAVGR